ncbi:traB domain-containing protein-like isoform X2 [Lineus longissimus]|uniref:traB domain-containing protein-like isoform X2 n=1 Tax=Lineus longissimus TaxID=88925 RepID=UPI00315DDCCD
MELNVEQEDTCTLTEVPLESAPPGLGGDAQPNKESPDKSSQKQSDSPVLDVDANVKDADADSLFSDDENEGNGSSGEESDIEDNDNDLYPSQRIRRSSNPDVPDTTVVLDTEEGGKVYVVGTAHFSEESQNDVVKLIQETQPDAVMVELCRSRVNVLELDEQTLLEEAKNINMDKVKAAIKQASFVRGIMHLLLLNMSAHITKQLGMAPGGEFRTAVKEAQKIPGCRIHLGDRPIQITLRRAFAALSFWQKLKLAWHMITNKDPISKEEVEKCKQKDLLEEMLKEMTGEFPALSSVFVAERDIFLAHSLHVAVQSIPRMETENGLIIPPVIVGVVGIGHVAGIVASWNNITSDAITELMNDQPVFDHQKLQHSLNYSSGRSGPHWSDYYPGALIESAAEPIQC